MAVDENEIENKEEIVVTEAMIDRVQFAFDSWVGAEDDELCVESIPSRQSLALFARLVFFP